MRLTVNDNDQIIKVYSDTYTAYSKRIARDAMSATSKRNYLDKQKEYSRIHREKKKTELIAKIKENPNDIFTLKQLREQTYNKTIAIQDQIALQIKQIIQDNLNSIPDVPTMIGLIRPIITNAKGYVESELTLEYTAQQIYEIKPKFRLQLKTSRMYVNAVRRLYDMLPPHIKGNTDQPISGNLMPLEFLRNTT